MDQQRNGEHGDVPSRKSRFFQHGKHWFFTTRECSIVGPYDSLQEAIHGCRKFVVQIRAISDFHHQPDNHGPAQQYA